MNSDRTFLTGHTPHQQINNADFQTTSSGQFDQVTLSQFESTNPNVQHGFRHGIMVQPLDGPAMKVFGSYEEINSLASKIKTDPTRVYNSLRPDPLKPSTSGIFALNGHVLPDSPYYNDGKTSEDQKSHADANLLFPDQGSDTRLETHQETQSREITELREDRGEAAAPTPGQTLLGGR